MSPVLTVVIPAYNAAATITSAIASALAQTLQDIEVIVIDDGSTDDTAARVAAIDDPRLRCLRQVNGGLSAARNAGLREARGPHVTLLDSDDLLLPSYAERMIDALDRQPRAGFAYTDAWVLDALSGRIRRRSAMARTRPPIPPPREPAPFLRELLRSNFVYVATTLRREVISEVGAFDERLRSSEDYDLWLRIVIAGYEAAWVEGRQAIYRKHPSQMSKDLRTMSASLVEVYDRIDPEALPSDAHRRLLDQQRRRARTQMRVYSRVRGATLLRVASGLKRAGIGERWLTDPPPDVQSAIAAQAAPSATQSSSART